MARLFQEARTLKIKQREEEKRPVIPLGASLAESWMSGGERQPRRERDAKHASVLMSERSSEID